jgi:hypothetical protein
MYFGFVVSPQLEDGPAAARLTDGPTLGADNAFARLLHGNLQAFAVAEPLATN